MSDWEDRLHGRLKGLPPLKAPPSLLPMVMEKVETSARWAWWAWPQWLRLSSLPGLAAAAYAVSRVGPGLLSLPQTAPWVARWRAAAALASAHGGFITTVGRALWEVLSALGRPLLIPVLLMYLVCAGGAVALWQMTLRPRGLRHT